MNEQGARDKQLPLFYNRPLAKSIPEKTFSKNEVVFLSWYKNCLQRLYFSGELMNLNEPVEIRMNVNEIAKRKGLTGDAISKFRKRMFLEAKNTFGNHIPAVWITDINSDGVMEEALIAACGKIALRTDGLIAVTSNVEFQKYYITHVMNRPELQVPVDFYLIAKSQYSGGFLEFLLAYISDIRIKENDIRSEYEFDVSYEILYKKVPPGKSSYSPADYRRYVIDKAIADINGNPYSPLHIDSANPVKGVRNAIIGYHFRASFTDAVRSLPPFLTYSDDSLVNPVTGCPSSQYVYDRLKRMNVAHSTIVKAQRSKPLLVVASCLMYVLSKGGSPALFNTAINNWRAEKDIWEYASDVRTFHPELMDDVIASIVPPKESGTPQKPNDMTNPEFRRLLEEKRRMLRSRR